MIRAFQVSAEEGARGQSGRIALCPRCRREILPQNLRPQFRGVYRGKEEPLDPRAERKRLAKERRWARRGGVTRETVRQIGILGAAKVFIEACGCDSESVDEECPDCLELQGAA